MSADPKPVVKGPKPRKPLNRASNVRDPRKQNARRWQCRFCPTRNEGSVKRCAGCSVRKGATRSGMDEYLMDLWHDVICSTGKCARCGKDRAALARIGHRLEAAHIIRRARSRNTRWHPRGGIPLCGPSMPGTCHYWYDEQASDMERAEFTIAQVERATYDELHRIKNEPWDRDLVKARDTLRAALAARKAAA